MNRTRLIYFASAFLVLGAHHAPAIVTSDTPGSHVVAPGETAFGLNLDGVARVEIGYPQIDVILRSASAALISDRHIITAAHVFDAEADGLVDTFLFEERLRLSAAFDAAGGPATITFSKVSVRISPDWNDTFADLAIVELDQPAPEGIPRYPLYGVGDELGQPTVVVGYGATGHGSTGVTDTSSVKRAGLNRFEAFGEQIDPGIADRIPTGSMLVIDFRQRPRGQQHAANPSRHWVRSRLWRRRSKNSPWRFGWAIVYRWCARRNHLVRLRRVCDRRDCGDRFELGRARLSHARFVVSGVHHHGHRRPGGVRTRTEHVGAVGICFHRCILRYPKQMLSAMMHGAASGQG
ncbi:MAG: trypsin-like serine protease [Pirellulales bacterium]